MQGAVSQEGVRIPGSSGPLYGTLANGQPRGGANGASGVAPYSTPPKPSLIDPVKLSESPGNGIWAPEPAMLEKISLPRPGTSSNDASENFFNMLQQSSSTANQQQIPFLSHADILLQQQQQQHFFNNGSRILNNQANAQLAAFSNRQHLMANVNNIVGSFGLDGMRSGSLPMGLSGNVKSVADLEMEMRLQHLKTKASLTDKVRLQHINTSIFFCYNFFSCYFIYQ